MDAAWLTSQVQSAANFVSHIDAVTLLENRWARAIGMGAIVWATIWVIALVYSGYTRDSVIGPVGLRPHTNKRLGGNKIVFDQSVFPFQMDGVEARCTFLYGYDDQDSKTRRIAISGKEMLQIHVRVSPIPRDQNTRYGFESDGEIGELDQELVIYPNFDPPTQPPLAIEPTPKTVREYIVANDLEPKWTEDDQAPIVSIGPTQLDLLASQRAEHIADRANRLLKAREGNFLQKTRAPSLAKERANVFGSYYIKMQFSKNPWFVLFKHPNRDLKMTAWLTVLTSFFAVAMDLWPVDNVDHAAAHPRTEQQESRPHSGSAAVSPSSSPAHSN